MSNPKKIHIYDEINHTKNRKVVPVLSGDFRSKKALN